MGKTSAFLSLWHPPCRGRGIMAERAADGHALEPASLFWSDLYTPQLSFLKSRRVSLQGTLALRTCPSNVEGHGSWHISRCDHLTPRVSRLMARCPELPVSPHCIGPSDRSAPKVSGRLWTFINGRLPIFAAKILS
jgi:hypothetical protein